MATLLAVSILGASRPAFAAPASFHATQDEQFAAAFGLARPAKSNVCDPWLRLPASGFAPFAVEEGEAGDAGLLQLGTAVATEDPDIAASAAPAPAPPRFLRSAGVPVLRTQYDERWRKVREAGLSAECAHKVLGSVGKPGSAEALLAFNRTVNRLVRYLDDARSGQGDSWAIASDTLTAGTGDCEDVAILKLQLLLALGAAEGDVYFTLVRDKFRKRDHAVVVIQFADRPVLLDSVSDLPIDAAEDGSYAAVMAFSGQRKWVLGAERQAAIVPSWPRRTP